VTKLHQKKAPRRRRQRKANEARKANEDREDKEAEEDIDRGTPSRRNQGIAGAHSPSKQVETITPINTAHSNRPLKLDSEGKVLLEYRPYSFTEAEI